MSANGKNAVVSVYDKTDLVEFLEGLDEQGWQMHATKGTQDAYREATGTEIGSISDYVASELGGEYFNKEVTAQRLSGIMLVRKSVQLACINLRPPRPEPIEGYGRKAVSVDVGGLSMIAAANNSGALVVTEPKRYERVLSELSAGDKTDPKFECWLKQDAMNHTAMHLLEAHKLVQPDW